MTPFEKELMDLRNTLGSIKLHKLTEEQKAILIPLMNGVKMLAAVWGT